MGTISDERPVRRTKLRPLKRYEAREALGYLPRGWIDGLTLSNDTTDATNDIGIAAGCARPP
jgi:hypothetical protein